jgi:hypothetical protein
MLSIGYRFHNRFSYCRHHQQFSPLPNRRLTDDVPEATKQQRLREVIATFYEATHSETHPAVLIASHLPSCLANLWQQH